MNQEMKSLLEHKLISENKVKKILIDMSICLSFVNAIIMGSDNEKRRAIAKKGIVISKVKTLNKILYK